MVSRTGEGDTTSHERPLREPSVLECVECGERSLSAVGWRGVRVDLPDEGDDPTLAFRRDQLSGSYDLNGHEQKGSGLWLNVRV